MQRGANPYRFSSESQGRPSPLACKEGIRWAETTGPLTAV
jgi:hypothetical protein